jgi:hypothetical protein
VRRQGLHPIILARHEAAEKAERGWSEAQKSALDGFGSYDGGGAIDALIAAGDALLAVLRDIRAAQRDA